MTHRRPRPFAGSGLAPNARGLLRLPREARLRPYESVPAASLVFLVRRVGDFLSSFTLRSGTAIGPLVERARLVDERQVVRFGSFFTALKIVAISSWFRVSFSRSSFASLSKTARLVVRALWASSI